MALKSSRFYKIDWKIMQNSSQTSCNKRQGTVACCSTLWASRLFSVRWTPIPDPMQVAMNKAHLHFISKRGMINNWKFNSYFDIVIMLDRPFILNKYIHVIVWYNITRQRNKLVVYIYNSYALPLITDFFVFYQINGNGL